MDRRKRLITGMLSLIFIVIAATTVSWWLGRQTDTQQTDGASRTTTQQPTFDKNLYPLDIATSPWVVVNKRRPLSPPDYAPQLVTPNVGLRLSGSNPEMQVSPQIAQALEQLFAAAKQDGLDLIVASAYRSYKTQTSVYNSEVNRNGQQAADRESARPGHSEHQTGMAVDVGAASRKCEIDVCFANMPEGQWVAANAYTYGFIIRYGEDSEAVTGYSYEPWHLRYVGTELAAELHQQANPPLETFFKLGAAPDYQ